MTGDWIKVPGYETILGRDVDQWFNVSGSGMITRLKMSDAGEHWERLSGWPYRYGIRIFNIAGSDTLVHTPTVEAARDIVRKIVGWVDVPDEPAVDMPTTDHIKRVGDVNSDVNFVLPTIPPLEPKHGGYMTVVDGRIGEWVASDELKQNLSFVPWLDDEIYRWIDTGIAKFRRDRS